MGVLIIASGWDETGGTPWPTELSGSSNWLRSWTGSSPISQPIQELADGFGGPQGPAEGPLWWHEGGYLVFSDIHNNRRMKYEPGKGVSLLQEPTNRANGLTRDLQGRLVACEHDSRRVTRQEHGRQHHRHRQQLSGSPAQPAQ